MVSSYLTVANQDMWCDVVNRRSTPVTLTVETKKEWGTVVDTSGEFTLAPDHVSTMKASPAARYCVFDIHRLLAGPVTPREAVAASVVTSRRAC